MKTAFTPLIDTMTTQSSENEKLENILLALNGQPRDYWAFRGTKREHAHAFIKYLAMMVPQMQN